MQIHCPSCGSLIEQNSPPIRGPLNDSEGWLCLKCPAMVCPTPITNKAGQLTQCYVDHLATAHPEAYQPHSGGHQKKPKHGKR